MGDVKKTTATGYVKSRQSWNSWMQPERDQAPLDAFASYLGMLSEWFREELPMFSSCGSCGDAGVRIALAGEQEQEEVIDRSVECDSPGEQEQSQVVVRT